ncbi:MAG: hypothetical protein ACHQ15_00530 [Candidatus Limnocylindrales bacterium]
MAVRLHLKIGIVPGPDRLPTSADTVIHREPETGSAIRSKGNLYGLVCVRSGAAGRSAEAAALVGATIRDRYYYDESAGIPVCLQKAVLAANQQLRHGREGSGLAEGALGVCVAVVRGHELYVATIGDADAYLVRSARLLSLPDADRGDGLPAPGDPRVHVWRGEIAVGDSLLLVSGNVTRLVGEEEFKNAVVTLHPQSAVEHLHHLFVAAGGDGSDTILALEASEAPVTRAEHRLVPVRPAEPLAGAPVRSPIPLADPLANAAAAVGDRVRGIRTILGGTVIAIADRLLDLLPRRAPRYRPVRPLWSRRDSQQRAGVAVLSLIGFFVVVGIGIWVLLPGKEGTIGQVNAGEAALTAATGEIDQVYSGGLIAADPTRATELLRQAWTDLKKATDLGVAEGTLRPLRDRATAGLDTLYGVRDVTSRVVFDLRASLSPNADVVDLVPGPDGAAYLLDHATSSLVRVDLATGKAKVVVTKGDADAGGRQIGEPWMLATAGPDIFILDLDSVLWRWRPSDAKGGGTLARLRLGGDTALGNDVKDMATFARNGTASLYFLYVVDPSSKQVLRFPPAADGSGYPAAPSDYLASPTDVTPFHQIFIDGDVYLLQSDRVVRYVQGHIDSFQLADPPDADDVRPGHDYRLMAASPVADAGRMWLWDAEWKRVLLFSKSTSEYLEQYMAAPGQEGFATMRGMYVVEGEGAPAVMIWTDGSQLLSTTLTQTGGPAASPSPSAGSSASVGASPSGSP